jgi:general secretion pathway protein J
MPSFGIHSHRCPALMPGPIASGENCRVASCDLRLSGQTRSSQIANRKSQIANSRGFTLLELLVALIMSGILAMSLFSTLYIAFKAQANSKADVEPIATVDMALDMIRADLQAAQPPAGVNEGQLEGSFEGVQNGSGGGDTLNFFTNGYAPQHQDGNGEIKNVFLTLEQKGNEQCLVRQMIPNILSQQTPVPDEEVICRNVTMFALEYYDGAEWQTSWDSTQYNNSLPAAVEVTLELYPPGARDRVRIRRVFALSCVTPPTAAASGSSSGTGSSGGGGKSGGTGSGGGSTAK